MRVPNSFIDWLIPIWNAIQMSMGMYRWYGWGFQQYLVYSWVANSLIFTILVYQLIANCLFLLNFSNFGYTDGSQICPFSLINGLQSGIVIRRWKISSSTPLPNFRVSYPPPPPPPRLDKSWIFCEQWLC